MTPSPAQQPQREHCDHECYFKREILNQRCNIPRCQYDTRARPHPQAPEKLKDDDAVIIYRQELGRLRSNAYWTGTEKSEAVILIESRSLLEHDAAIARTATLAAYEELWKFCLTNGCTEHGDLLGLSNDPFFPLKLVKHIAEKRYESLRTQSTTAEKQEEQHE
jgi:hypothetical protein